MGGAGKEPCRNRSCPVPVHNIPHVASLYNRQHNILHFYHQVTRTHTVLTGRKTPMPLQSPCQYTKYCLRAFHCLNAFLLRQNCCAPDSDGFLCDFWFLSRRRADARQGEKDKKHPAHSMQSPAKWVCMEKEEGDCLVQLLPQGGSGTAQASSDVVRRVCSCQLMVHKDIYIGSRCLILLTQRK